MKNIRFLIYIETDECIKALPIEIPVEFSEVDVIKEDDIHFIAQELCSMAYNDAHATNILNIRPRITKYLGKTFTELYMEGERILKKKEKKMKKRIDNGKE